MSPKYFITAITILLATISCNNQDETPVQPIEQRSFYMGTTPWPADFTVTEVNNAYDFINNHCDIVSHHFDNEIPYEEAFSNLPMPSELLQDINTRKTKTATNKKVLLSVSALDLTRKQKGNYHKNSLVSTTIQNSWMALPFNNSNMVTAYVNYVSYLVDELHPTYVNYGVESNVSTWNTTDFANYKIFLSQVYSQLKIKYPTIPFFISFIVDESPEGFNFANQLISYTDYIGLSAYPYITVSSSASGNTDSNNFPANYFEKFINLSSTKPFAFAETGYIAENLVISSFSLNKQGNEAWQKQYLEKVLELCNNKRAKFFIWFCHKDYDAGIVTLQNLGLYQDLFLLWKDIGLVNQNGINRPAYNSWITWMNKPKVD